MRRFAVIAGSIVGVLVLVVALMFAFGRPQSAPSQAVASESSADSTASQEAASEEAEPEEAAPSGPLAIEIPGCVCHSKDPKLVEEHSKYRMSQCAGCHNGGVPTGAR